MNVFGDVLLKNKLRYVMTCVLFFNYSLFILIVIEYLLFIVTAAVRNLAFSTILTIRFCETISLLIVFKINDFRINTWNLRWSRSGFSSLLYYRISVILAAMRIILLPIFLLLLLVFFTGINYIVENTSLLIVLTLAIQILLGFVSLRR